MQRSLEHFSKGVDKLSGGMINSDIEQARNKILEYRVLLKKMQTQLIKFEKLDPNLSLSLATGSSPVVIKEYYENANLAQMYFGSASSIQPIPLSKTMIRSMKKIEDLNPLDPTFSAQVEEIINSIADDAVDNYDGMHYCFLGMHQILLKKIGSLKNIDQLRFSNPAKAVASLHYINTQASNQSVEMENYLTILLTHYLLENAMRQLPDEIRIIEKEFPSFLDWLDRDRLEHSSCHDPQWTCYIQELKSKEFKNVAYVLPTSATSFYSSTHNEFELDPRMNNNIIKWWNRTENKELLEAVQKVIVKDRKDQEALITKTIDECKARISNFEKDLKEQKESLKTLDKLYVKFSHEDIKDSPEFKALNKKIVFTEQKIQETLLKIVETPNLVHAMPIFWPWGWEDVPESMSIRDQAAFLFGQGDEIIKFFKSKNLDIPVSDLHPLRNFYSSAIIASTFTHRTINPNDKIILKRGAGIKLYIEKVDVRTNTVKEFNLHLRNFSDPETFEKIIHLGDVQTNVPFTTGLIFNIENNSSYVTSSTNHTTSLSPKKLNREEFKELCSIRNPGIQIDANLNYFTENFKKLSDKDFFWMFHYNLFESDLLLEGLRDNTLGEKLVSQLNAFFEQRIHTAIELEDFRTAGRLLFAKSGIQKYIDLVSIERTEKGVAPLKSIFSYDEILPMMQKASAPKHEKHWPIILRSLVAACDGFEKKNCSRDELSAIFMANVLMGRFPFAGDLILNQDISSVQFNIRKYFDQTFEEKPSGIDFFNDEILQLVIKIFPAIQGLKSDSQDMVISNDGKTRISLAQGVVASSDPALFKRYNQTVPQTHFDVFIKNGLVTDEDKIKDFRMYNDGPISNFYIDEKSNQEYHIGMNTWPEVSVKLQINGVAIWARQKINFCKSNPPHNDYLNRNYNTFHAAKNIYICEKVTNKPLYQSRDDGLLIDLESGWHLVNDNSKNTGFATFESSSETILLASDEGKLKRIKFPRLKLSFSANSNVNKPQFESDQYPGWNLSNDQFAPHLNPSTGFLCIERIAKDGTIEKKIIIPVWDPLEQKDSSLNFPYQFNVKTEVNEARYVECDLKNNELQPVTLEARLHLGNIYLQKGFQDLAENLLFSSSALVTNRALTMEEKQLLEKIVFANPSGNISGRALSVRLHALYLLRRDEAIFLDVNKVKTDQRSNGRKAGEKLLKIEIDLFNEYLSRQGQTKLLPEHEELLILKSLDPRTTNDPIISRRLKELEGLDVGAPISTGSVKIPGKYSKYTNNNREETIERTRINEGILYDKRADLQKKADKPMTFLNAIGYWKARLTNTFPFDYADKKLTVDVFDQYIKKLHSEASNTDYETARSNGLLSMLFHLSEFTTDILIREDAKTMLELIHEKDIKTRYEKNNSLISSAYHQPVQYKGQVVPNKKRLAETPYQKDILNLWTLNTVKNSSQEDSYLANLGKEYLIRTEQPGPSSGGNLFKTSSLEAVDETTKDQFTYMQKDIEIAEEKLKDLSFSMINGKTVDVLYDKLSDSLIAEKEKLALMELEITQAVTSALTNDAVSELQFASKLRQMPKIQELSILSARTDSDASLRRRMPELTEEGVKTLKNALKNYLVQKQFVQHIDRAKIQIEGIRKAEGDNVEPETIAIMRNNLGTTLTANRCYDLENKLALPFLIVETILNIKLRNDQVDNIGKFQNAKQNGEEVVLQMIMGAGKTSVIQPILSFLFASPDTLSTVCVPLSLFVDVRAKLQEVLGESYEQFVYVMPFDRSLAKNKDYLNTYLEGLQQARKQGAVILFTPEQKKSILAGWKESLSNNSTDVFVRYRYKICNDTMNKILIEFQSELSQIDEIDMTMDPGTIFKFALDSGTQVDSKRAAIVSNIVFRIAGDAELSKKVSLDFANKFHERADPNFKREGAELTPNLYLSEVQPKLLAFAKESLNEAFGNKLDSVIEKDNEKFLSHFIMQTTPMDDEIRRRCSPAEEREIVQKIYSKINESEGTQAYQPTDKLEILITNREVYKSDARNWIDKNISDLELKNAITVCSHCISSILNKTLFKECGTNYDIDPDSKVFTARPYFAPASPKQSIPSDCYEQVIDSTQLLLYRGIPLDAISGIFSSMQKEADREMIGSQISIIQTEAYEEFKRLLGDKAKKFEFRAVPPTEDLIFELKAAMDKDTKSMKMFMNNYVCKQVRTFKTSLSVTPQSFIGISDQTCGYTGTLHKGILTPTMKPQAEIGTDGKTIAALESNFKSGAAKIISLNSDEESYLGQIKKAFTEDKNLFVFIDSGNLLKEEAKLETYVDATLKSIVKGGGVKI